MKRVILDTNIYGLIIVDESIDKLKEDLDKKNIFIVYGFPLIRKELRDTPKSIKLESANLRNRLLSIYDEITKNHTLKLTSNIGKLSDSYFDIYKKIGGHASKNEMIKDLTIVACASLNLLDKSRIVISVTGTPGHHASFNRNYGGLCYYNNAATLACRLTAKRINTAVLDLDSHFGNGTADIANLHKLPVIDLHEQTWASPFSEGGNPIQTNYTFSHPLAIASNRDLYLISLRKAIKRIRQLDLSVLIVSLGVDAHINDPFGLLALDTETYVEIGKELGSLLDSSNLKCIFLTEGGYGKLSPYLFALTVSEANKNLYKNQKALRLQNTTRAYLF